MDNLRLILMLFGICVIAGIYILDKAQSRVAIKKRTISSAGNFNKKNETFFSEEPDQEETFSSEFANLNNFLSGTKSSHDSDPVLPEITDLNEIEENQDSVKISSEDIITLHIVPADGNLFTGKDIKHALSDLGFQFGSMDIFHYYDLDTNKPLISLANMFEPGSFNIETMDSFSTVGLSLFICLPTPIPAMIAFETMLNMVHELAEKLNGDICGPNRNPLSELVLDEIHRKLHYYD